MQRVIHFAMAGLVAALAGFTFVEPASAQSANPAAVIQERQELMKNLFPAFRPVRDEVQAGQTPDLDAVATAARRYADLTKKIVTLFPAGTGREVNPDTRAKPEIWSQRAEFEATAKTLADEAEKLAVVAATKNIDAILAQVGPTGQACGGCHGGPATSGGKFRFEKM